MTKKSTKKNSKNTIDPNEILDGEIVESSTVSDLPAEKLEWKVALANLDEKNKQDVLALSNSIDVRKLENVMAYGSEPLVKTFAQCENILKNERGSSADQAVIEQVRQLAQVATKNYQDFKIALREPNFAEKWFMKIFGSKGKGKSKSLNEKALTNFKLLSDLKASCNDWLVNLRDSAGLIEQSREEDLDNAQTIELYLIAGYNALERIDQEIAEAERKFAESNLQKDSAELEKLKIGKEKLEIRLAYLEKSLAMYKLSLGQLGLVKSGNIDLQFTIRTTSENTMALLGTMLRNAILNQKNKEVIENQKAIFRLNDELVKEVSKSAGLTAEEAKSLVYNGVVSSEAALQAVESVIKSCDEIVKIGEEGLVKMRQDTEQLRECAKKLEPCISEATQNQLDSSSGFTKVENKSTSRGALKF